MFFYLQVNVFNLYAYACVLCGQHSIIWYWHEDSNYVCYPCGSVGNSWPAGKYWLPTTGFE